jgi:sec-independent protein translocase protein TatA
MPTTLPLQFGLPGGPELLIILFIAVLLFGANKLPALARSSGQAMGEFKRGRQELEDEIKRGVEDGGDDDSATATDATPEIETESRTEDAEHLGETEVVS